MTEKELGKGMDAYKQKTDLFPHPKVISKRKKYQKNVRVSHSNER